MRKYVNGKRFRHADLYGNEIAKEKHDRPLVLMNRIFTVSSHYPQVHFLPSIQGKIHQKKYRV